MKDVQIIIIKDVDQTIENETKEQRGRFFVMSLGTLGTALLRKMLAGKWVIRVEDGIIRLAIFLMLPYLLSNFEIHKYYHNEPKLKLIFTWNTFPRTLIDGTFLKYPYEYKSIETKWIVLFCMIRVIMWNTLLALWLNTF